MIVADTDLILYPFLETEQTATAELVFRRDPDWRAPALWMSECRNALVLYVRKGLIALEGAVRTFEDARSAVTTTDAQGGADAVVRVAPDGGLSGHDAWFVASRSNPAYIEGSPALRRPSVTWGFKTGGLVG